MTDADAPRPRPADHWHMYREIGALVGHPEPADFANFMTAPPCAHDAKPLEFDDEVCPQPCGKQHHWCTSCGAPVKPVCRIVEGDETRRRVAHVKLAFPQVTVYRVADPGFRAMWNRYPSGVIGAAVVLGHRCYGLRWAKP